MSSFFLGLVKQNAEIGNTVTISCFESGNQFKDVTWQKFRRLIPQPLDINQGKSFISRIGDQYQTTLCKGSTNSYEKRTKIITLLYALKLRMEKYPAFGKLKHKNNLRFEIREVVLVGKTVRQLKKIDNIHLKTIFQQK